jgi:GDPmannose 4,6-dehydratase
MRRALITGIAGQDGSYLAEWLLAKDYEVHGIVREGSSLKRLQTFNSRLVLHRADLNDPVSVRRILTGTAPAEIYHLGAQSHVGLSFEQAEATCEAIAIGTLRLLEVLRTLPQPPRFFNASSSEIFGRPETSPQDEQTPFRPATPYGCAKAFATQMVAIQRQTFGLFAVNGILYNHESPRRGDNFVTQKICCAAAAIKQGRQREVFLGNLASRRDWGAAREYVQAMWLMLQQETPEDFVLATGKLHSVQEVVEMAFAAVGLNWREHVKVDPRFLRPDDPSQLVGNPAKAEKILGWRPTADFRQLITEMTLAALENTPA